LENPQQPTNQPTTTTMLTVRSSAAARVSALLRGGCRSAAGAAAAAPLAVVPGRRREDLLRPRSFFGRSTTSAARASPPSPRDRATSSEPITRRTADSRTAFASSWVGTTSGRCASAAAVVASAQRQRGASRNNNSGGDGGDNGPSAGGAFRETATAFRAANGGPSTTTAAVVIGRRSSFELNRSFSYRTFSSFRDGVVVDVTNNSLPTSGLRKRKSPRHQYANVSPRIVSAVRLPCTPPQDRSCCASFSTSPKSNAAGVPSQRLGTTKVPTPPSAPPPDPTALEKLRQTTPKGILRKGLDVTISVFKAAVLFLLRLPGRIFFYGTHPDELRQAFAHIKQRASEEVHHYWVGTKVRFFSRPNVRFVLLLKKFTPPPAFCLCV